MAEALQRAARHAGLPLQLATPAGLPSPAGALARILPYLCCASHRIIGPPIRPQIPLADEMFRTLGSLLRSAGEASCSGRGLGGTIESVLRPYAIGPLANGALGDTLVASSQWLHQSWTQHQSVRGVLGAPDKHVNKQIHTHDKYKTQTWQPTYE